MILKLVTPPAEDPVSLVEVKAHLRITHSDEDTRLGTLTKMALAHLDGADGIVGRALVTQTWDYKLNGFPCGAIKTPLPPLQSVTSITYIDADGVEQTLAGADYRVLANEWFPVIEPAYGMNWPTTRCVREAVVIRMVVGYGAAAAVPQTLKQALLLRIEALYDKDSKNSEFLIRTSDALISPHRIAF